MAATRLTDVVVPAVWNQYITEKTAELSALYQSGIVQEVPELSFGAGNTVNVPFWQDLSGNSEVVSATGSSLSVNPIGSAQDVAVVLTRGKGWGANELAAALAGDDPMRAIADLVAAWWARDMQDTGIAILTGVFGSLAAESPVVNTLDISGLSGAAAVIDDEAILDTIQLLGDSKGKLTAVAMHSATETKLKKLDLIDYVQPSSESTVRVPMYMDKRVVVDDSMPVPSTGVYDTYFFGAGALGYAEDTSGLITNVETDRVAAAGEDHLFSRRRFILHPRGVKYVGAATAGGPANSVLDDAASWTRVYEAKNVRLTRLRHKLA